MARAKPNRPREAGLNLARMESAIEEFFEEGYAYQVSRSEIEETPQEHRAAALRDMLPVRSQAEGYFVWLRYLVWLDDIREFAPNLLLTAVEAEGLLLLRRARNYFQRTHPPCYHCGMPNDEYRFNCYHCLKELRR